MSGDERSRPTNMPLEFVTFGGQPNEDVTVFLQNVKRVAFSQGRNKDDEWLVEYIETCLTGTALRWFNSLSLDNTADTRSWISIRAAFLGRFGPVEEAAPPPAAAAPAAAAPAPAQARARVSSTISRTLSSPARLPSSIVDAPNVVVRKILLVGDSGVGKSCLLHRMLGQGWAPWLTPTEDVQYETMSVIQKDKQVDRHFWDTPGRFRGLVAPYTSHVTLVVVVYDVTNQDSFTNVRKWHDLATRASPKLQTTLVAAKTDLTEQRKVTEDMGVRLAASMDAFGHYETSAKTNEGVNALLGGWLHQKNK